MKGPAWYAVALVTIVAAAGWAMTRAFPGAESARAIGVSGALAVVVQFPAFLMARRLTRHHLLLGWGAGMLLRLLTLLVYGLLAVRGFGLPPAPALISLALFFFLSTLIEPLLIRP